MNRLRPLEHWDHKGVQTTPGARTTSYATYTKVLSLGVKRKKREADHLFPSGNEIKNCGAVSPVSPMSSQRVTSLK
jgi:hypothetical protein